MYPILSVQSFLVITATIRATLLLAVYRSRECAHARMGCAEFPSIIPGTTRSPAYLAFPVTFSAPSTRCTEVPMIEKSRSTFKLQPFLLPRFHQTYVRSDMKTIYNISRCRSTSCRYTLPYMGVKFLSSSLTGDHRRSSNSVLTPIDQPALKTILSNSALTFAAHP